MYLTESELQQVRDNRGRLGIPGNVQRVHCPLGESRDAVIREMMKADEAIARGDFEVVASVDEDTTDWTGTYWALRSMGWSRWRSLQHVCLKWWRQ